MIKILSSEKAPEKGLLVSTKIDLKEVWSGRKKTVIRIAILFFAIILANKVIYQPQVRKIKMLEDQIVGEKEKNKLADEINELGNKINSYRQKISTPGDISLVINEVFKIAKDMKIEIVSLQPQQTEEETLYVRLPLKVVIEAGYHELGRFLSRIESSEKFIKVDNLQISTAEVGSAGVPTLEEGEKPRATLMLSGTYLK